MKDPFREGYPGWSEAVISVRDLDQAQPLEKAGGWQRLHEGEAPAALATAWGLPAGTRIRERLLHVPEMAYGYLRFVQITGLPQQLIRPADAAPWDTGGLWLIYTRARDDAALSRRLVAAGWPSPRGVHHFEFGGLSVNEVHHLGPEGMVLSTIEQISPPMELPGEGLTHAFNAAVLVRDLAASRRFFVEQLGFQPWMEVSWAADNPGLGLLADMDAFEGMDTVDTVIVHPQAQNLGSIELIGWSGQRKGRDFSAAAHPPNLGSMALRFGVADLDAWLDRLQRFDIRPAYPTGEMTLAPYGKLRIAAVVSPDGIWLEFFEVTG